MSNIYHLLSPVLAHVRFTYGFEHWHWCPACKEIHRYAVDQPFYNEPGRPQWTFNGNLEKPTFMPSMLIRWGNPPDGAVCHYFIKNGMIEFCGDCTHELKGQTVPLPPIPDHRLKSWGLL